jgi:glucokinase
VSTQLPMVSRILHLLVIDILAVGVAMKRGAGSLAEAPGDASATAAMAAGEADPASAPATSGRHRPGVRTAGTLAHLTSHSR